MIIRLVLMAIYDQIVIFFLFSGLNIGFECSKEPSQRDGSIEYSQHMFSLLIEKEER